MTSKGRLKKNNVIKLEEKLKNLSNRLKRKLEEQKELKALYIWPAMDSIVIAFRSESQRTLYYRVSPINCGLVFAEPKSAERISRIRNAMDAKTWGELKAMLTPGEYDEIVSRVLYEEEEPEPKISDPFDFESVPGYCDGDYPDWLQQDMDSCVPEEILQKYAIYELTALNGSYYHIEEEHEEAICQDLRARGINVVKRDDLFFI